MTEVNFYSQGAKSVDGFLLMLGVGFLPIYVFSSGGVQPSHMILALFSLMVFFRKGVPSRLWVFFLAAISLYSFLVETFYVMIGGQVSTLISGVFFSYNLMLVMAVYCYCRRYGLSAITLGVLSACAVSLMSLSFTGVSVEETEQVRATGMFNNPNQLGYFSVCILSLTYLLYSHRQLKYTAAVVLFAVAVFLSVISLSKAAMIANFLVAFLALKPIKRGRYDNNSLFSKEAGFWLFLVLIVIAAIIVFYVKGAFDDFLFFRRLQGITQEVDSSLESRGYFAFFEGNTLQIFFGLGSGNVGEIVGHEVHSTIASVLNNYGIVGFFLFTGALVVWALNLWRAYGFLGMCCLAGPAMLYGVTHNGTRFTAFWVLFGASMAMSYCVIEGRKSAFERNAVPNKAL